MRILFSRLPLCGRLIPPGLNVALSLAVHRFIVEKILFQLRECIRVQRALLNGTCGRVHIGKRRRHILTRLCVASLRIELLVLLIGHVPSKAEDFTYALTKGHLANIRQVCKDEGLWPMVGPDQVIKCSDFELWYQLTRQGNPSAKHLVMSLKEARRAANSSK